MGEFKGVQTAVLRDKYEMWSCLKLAATFMTPGITDYQHFPAPRIFKHFRKHIA